MKMVHPVRDCILSNKFILNLIISFALIVIYIYSRGFGYVAASSNPSQNASRDLFHEDLYIRPLSDGKLLAHFQFLTTYRKDIKSLRWENKIEILPLSIIDLVTTTGLNELHFSLTKGNWNYKSWGYPTRPSPPGAQIRASFSKHKKNLEDIWRRLSNSLAGKFCSSLASANDQTLVLPSLSFDTEQSLNISDKEHVLYTNLPEETLCTGNLTPWKKLLPCHNGLASLLNAIHLFKSSYSSLAVDLTPNNENVHLKQTITVVFNPLQQFEGKQTWSLAKMFGTSIKKTCSLSEHSKIHVDITDLDDRNKLYPHKIYVEHSLRDSVLDRRYAIFDLKQILSRDKPLNIGVKQNHLFKRTSIRESNPVSLRTHIAGLGAYDGTIVANIRNSMNESVRVTYMDIVPYFMNLYLHTLRIRISKSGQELKPDKMNYVLARDEKSPSLIELSMILPANSEVQISYYFERAFLRWTDHKPDANKGILLSSALISFSKSHTPIMRNLAIPLCSSDLDGTEDATQVYARPLLVILPTPDFSMPYNVLCMVSTVLVFIFGPIYNLTIRRPIFKRKKSSAAAPKERSNESDTKDDSKKND